jgi:hypothetical protein
MKAIRGYFSTDLQGNVHWIESNEGLWLLHPVEGLRQATNEELIQGVDQGDTGVFVQKTIQNEK